MAKAVSARISMIMIVKGFLAFHISRVATRRRLSVNACTASARR
jgi:hypothetical protein